jgi:hypothetical protein
MRAAPDENPAPLFLLERAENYDAPLGSIMVPLP